MSNRLEVDQARANRALTAASIPEIERQIAILEHAISVLAGRAPGAIARGRTLDRTARLHRSSRSVCRHRCSSAGPT